MNKKTIFSIMGLLLGLMICAVFFFMKGSTKTIDQVHIIDTTSNIPDLELTAEVSNEKDNYSNVEIFFENNSSQKLYFKEVKVFCWENEKWEEIKCLQQNSLLERWSIFTLAEATWFNSEARENICDNTYHFSISLWSDYSVKESGMYKVEVIFMDDTDSEIGSAWITLEQTIK